MYNVVNARKPFENIKSCNRILASGSYVSRVMSAIHRIRMIRSVTKFVFRSEKFPEGFRLRLVLRGSSDLFTLEEALAHCGIGTIVGTLTDDYSTLAARQAVNLALSNAGLPICVWAA